MSLISLKDVRRSYGHGDNLVRALDGVSFDVEPGEFVALTGPSGSGKSTCLNVLGCLDRPTSGSYRLCGVEVGALDQEQQALVRRHRLGFVFQGFNLLQRTTALENVELPLVYRGVARAERRRRAEEALRSVGLGDRLTHTPSELSGGQQQRVAIARAIVGNPSVLLADEPTGNLDSVRRKEILDLMVELNRNGITILMVTHEQDSAAVVSREIRFADGKIVADSGARRAA
jgi:putative ABC transport system ATP-binding protein